MCELGRKQGIYCNGDNRQAQNRGMITVSRSGPKLIQYVNEQEDLRQEGHLK